MKKIITIVGARPQFVKAAIVSKSLRKVAQEKIIHTGQHFDKNMSDIFFKEMEIPFPDYSLNINSLGHGAMTGRMLEQVEKILLQEKPDMVLVYGDTNSTLAGALAASKIHIPVAHVEAGLRSFNIAMPEEINRILTDRTSTLLFCPTEKAVENLHNEGFKTFGSKIINSGDVMYDAALYYSSYSKIKSSIIELQKLQNQDFILTTIHRQENTDDLEKLGELIEALNELSKVVKIVFLLHPRTKNILLENNIKLNFKPLDPVGYFDMLELLKNCSLVLTDSGGLQKEAFFFKKYCITAREQTEWVELVENGYNMLTDTRKEKILSAFKELSSKELSFSSNLYGDGNASAVIAQNIKNL